MYNFNKSHAASYALLAYYTAWLKYYYPLEFMTALMTSERAEKDKVIVRIRQCKDMGIKVLPPDINKSKEEYTIDGDNIRFSINTIEAVGEAKVQEIQNLGNIKNLEDLFNRANKRILSRGAMINLIKAGCFDFENEDRCQMIREYFKLRNDSKDKKLFEEYKDLQYSDKLAFEFEKEVLGISIKHNPLDSLNTSPLTEQCDKCICVGEIVNVKKIKDRNGNKMAFLTIVTEYETIDAVVFSNTFKQLETTYSEDRVYYVIKGKQNGINKIIVNDIKYYNI